MDRYNSARDVTPEFMARVSGWIAVSGEVFMVLRYLRAAGQKDYVFCRSVEDFRALVDSVPMGTDIIVFEHPQLPIRGISSQEFIEHCVAQIPDDMEYVVAQMHQPVKFPFQFSGFLDGSHASLREDLASFAGQTVAVGPCPNFNGPDCESMISASKGGIDGPR